MTGKYSKENFLDDLVDVLSKAKESDLTSFEIAAVARRFARKVDAWAFDEDEE